MSKYIVLQIGLLVVVFLFFFFLIEQSSVLSWKGKLRIFMYLYGSQFLRRF